MLPTLLLAACHPPHGQRVRIEGSPGLVLKDVDLTEKAGERRAVRLEREDAGAAMKRSGSKAIADVSA